MDDPIPKRAAAMYETATMLARELRVHYPPGRGRIVLRSELDWELDLEPVNVSEDGATSTFRIEARRPFLYFKACLSLPDGGVLWTIGPNMLPLMTTDDVADVY